MLKIKHVYEAVEKSDGKRFLVERLWPHGMKKEALKMDAWLKNVAPSTDLRNWFMHDPLKWAEFQKRYQAELRANSAEWQVIIEAAQKGDVTLLYSAHDIEHNNAQALKSFLDKRLKR
jgi:uncharacterized protein YeaO (DUF488 family)